MQVTNAPEKGSHSSFGADLLQTSKYNPGKEHTSIHLKEKSLSNVLNKITFVPVERPHNAKPKTADHSCKSLNNHVISKFDKENTDVATGCQQHNSKFSALTSQFHLEESENVDQKTSTAYFNSRIIFSSYVESENKIKNENSVLFQESSTEEYHVVIPSSMRRERRSRNERSKPKTSRSGCDNSQLDNSASYFSARNASQDCLNNDFNSQVMSFNQINDQTIESSATQRLSSSRAKNYNQTRNQNLGYASSREKENVLSYRSTNREESWFLDSYRSLQGRVVNKSCENGHHNFKELYDNQDPKMKSIYRMLNSLGQNKPETYRERSENKKALKMRINQTVYHSSRDNISLSNRDTQQAVKKGIIDNLKEGYREIAKKSKVEKKETGRKVHESLNQSVLGDKALQPRNFNKGTGKSDSMSVCGDKKSRNRDNQSKERTVVSNCQSVKENMTKGRKFSIPKSSLESTYYDEFIRRKKLNEKLLQPRGRNLQSISQEKRLIKKFETNNNVSDNKISERSLEFRVEVNKKPTKHSQAKSKSSTRKNNENKEVLQSEYKSCNSDHQSGKVKKSSVITHSSLIRQQNQDLLPRLDRIADKTIVEKTYVEKAKMKNKTYLGNPSINPSTNRSRRENFESLIEEEQSQAENLTHREEILSSLNSVREHFVCGNVTAYGIEGITQQLERLAGKHIENKQSEDKEALCEMKDKINSKSSLPALEKNSNPKKEDSLLYKVKEDKEMEGTKEFKDESDLTWSDIRKLEDRAARKIQALFINKFGKIRSSELNKLNHKGSYNNIDAKQVLVQSYQGFEDLYTKIVSVVENQDAKYDKNDLATAFVTAYSCLNNSDFSRDQLRDMIQKITTSCGQL